MLNFGIFEIVIICALALIFVGPERLPTMVRFLGRQYGKLMRASDELRRAFVLEAEREDAERRAAALRKRREEARARAEEARKRAIEARERGEEPPVEPVERELRLPGVAEDEGQSPTTLAEAALAQSRSKLTEQDALTEAARSAGSPPAEEPAPAPEAPPEGGS